METFHRGNNEMLWNDKFHTTPGELETQKKEMLNVLFPCRLERERERVKRATGDGSI